MPDEDELEKLREQKKQERMQEQQEAREEQKEQVENQIWTQAKQYMTEDARNRLSNIKLADKEKAIAVAQQITRLGKSGRVRNVDDNRMKEILKNLNEEEKGKESDIKFRR